MLCGFLAERLQLAHGYVHTLSELRLAREEDRRWLRTPSPLGIAYSARRYWVPTDLPEVYFVTALPAPLVDRIGRSRVLALRGLEGVIELAAGSIVLRVTREPEGALNQEGMATRADARAQLESNVDAGAELKRLERRARFVAPVVARWDSPTSELVRRIAGECFDEGHRLSLLRRLRDHTPAPIREADTEQ